MATHESQPRFDTFREAYCALMRVPDARFSRDVLFRCMAGWRRPVARLILLTSPEVFAADFSVIDGLGTSRSAHDCETSLNELDSINRVERGFRRGLFGFRVSGQRLSDLWDLVQPYIREPEALPAFVPKAGALPERKGGEAAGVRNAPAVVLRRLKQVHADLTAGVPAAEALAAASFADEADFRAVVQANAPENKALAWLLQQLDQQRLAARLEDENARLKQVVAEQSMELSRLRAREKPGAGAS